MITLFSVSALHCSHTGKSYLSTPIQNSASRPLRPAKISKTLHRHNGTTENTKHNIHIISINAKRIVAASACLALICCPSATAVVVSQALLGMFNT